MDGHSPESSSLYSMEFPTPAIPDDDGKGTVLIHALEGFADAGHAVGLAAQHLRESLDSELVATFDADELIRPVGDQLRGGAAERIPPRNAYLEFEAQPAKTMP